MKRIWKICSTSTDLKLGTKHTRRTCEPKWVWVEKVQMSQWKFSCLLRLVWRQKRNTICEGSASCKTWKVWMPITIKVWFRRRKRSEQRTLKSVSESPKINLPPKRPKLSVRYKPSASNKKRNIIRRLLEISNLACTANLCLPFCRQVEPCIPIQKSKQKRLWLIVKSKSVSRRLSSGGSNPHNMTKLVRQISTNPSENCSVLNNFGRSQTRFSWTKRKQKSSDLSTLSNRLMFRKPESWMWQRNRMLDQAPTSKSQQKSWQRRDLEKGAKQCLLCDFLRNSPKIPNMIEIWMLRPQKWLAMTWDLSTVPSPKITCLIQNQSAKGTLLLRPPNSKTSLSRLTCLCKKIWISNKRQQRTKEGLLSAKSRPLRSSLTNRIQNRLLRLASIALLAQLVWVKPPKTIWIWRVIRICSMIGKVRAVWELMASGVLPIWSKPEFCTQAHLYSRESKQLQVKGDARKRNKERMISNSSWSQKMLIKHKIRVSVETKKTITHPLTRKLRWLKMEVLNQIWPESLSISPKKESAKIRTTIICELWQSANKRVYLSEFRWLECAHRVFSAVWTKVVRKLIVKHRRWPPKMAVWQWICQEIGRPLLPLRERKLRQVEQGVMYPLSKRFSIRDSTLPLVLLLSTKPCEIRSDWIWGWKREKKLKTRRLDRAQRERKDHKNWEIFEFYFHKLLKNFHNLNQYLELYS